MAKFEASIDPTIRDDLRYDYRVRLVPIVGPKTDADLALNFVNIDDLSEAERKTMIEAGRTGTVLIKTKNVEVAGKDKLLPKQVCLQVESELPFRFAIHQHTEMWHRLNVRPAHGDKDPYATETKYCVFNETFKQYAYTQAWVKRIVSEIDTVEKYHAFFGRYPVMKTAADPAQSDDSASSAPSEVQAQAEPA